MEPVRFHHLKTIGTRSAAHLRAMLDTGEDDPTYAMERGTAVHAMLFGTRRVVGYDAGKQRRGKEWEAFEVANAGAEILTARDYDAACRMADAVSSNADAMAVLGGQRETTLRWTMLGRDCRGTPDSCESGQWLTELKTARDSSVARFGKQAVWMAYNAQLAWYRQAMVATGLSAPRDCYIVAVESTVPYPVTVFRLTERALDKGDRLVRLWFERLLACEAAQQWPAYVQSVVELDVPDDDELVFGDDEAVVEAA